MLLSFLLLDVPGVGKKSLNSSKAECAGSDDERMLSKTDRTSFKTAPRPLIWPWSCDCSCVNPRQLLLLRASPQVPTRRPPLRGTLRGNACVNCFLAAAQTEKTRPSRISNFLKVDPLNSTLTLLIVLRELRLCSNSSHMLCRLIRQATGTGSAFCLLWRPHIGKTVLEGDRTKTWFRFLTTFLTTDTNICTLYLLH